MVSPVWLGKIVGLKEMAEEGQAVDRSVRFAVCLLSVVRSGVSDFYTNVDCLAGITAKNRGSPELEGTVNTSDGPKFCRTQVSV